MQRLTNTFKWLNIILIFLTLLSYLAPFVNPQLFWPFAFLGVGYPWFLLVNICFVIFWIVLKEKYFLFSFFCLLLGWVHLQSFIGLNFSNQNLPTNAITVMTYNINKLLHIQLKNPTKRKLKTNAFLNFIKEEIKPDIFCTQETVKENVAFIETNLKFRYHHNIIRKGTAIFSNHPIVRSGEVNMGTSANACLWADIKIRNKIVRVYSLHLLSNKVSKDADLVFENGKIKSKKTWQKVKNIFWKFGKASPYRVKQIKEVIAHIKESEFPVIVCGDLNEIPQSYTYHLLADFLQDAFREKAFGFGTTYAGRIPALRIDYIFAGNNINLLDHSIHRVNFSDHYPVVSRMSFPF